MKKGKTPEHVCELCDQPTDCPLDVCGSMVCEDCLPQAMRDHGVRDDGINGFVPINRSAHLGAGAMRRTLSKIVVEYDRYGKFRDTKEFPTNGAARKFYDQMVKECRNPRIVSAAVNG
jgi:hypothetical protein